MATCFGPSLDHLQANVLNTLRTGDVDLRFYITTVQDGWRKFAEAGNIVGALYHKL